MNVVNCANHNGHISNLQCQYLLTFPDLPPGMGKEPTQAVFLLLQMVHLYRFSDHAGKQGRVRHERHRYLPLWRLRKADRLPTIRNRAGFGRVKCTGIRGFHLTQMAKLGSSSGRFTATRQPIVRHGRGFRKISKGSPLASGDTSGRQTGRIWVRRWGKYASAVNHYSSPSSANSASPSRGFTLSQINGFIHQEKVDRASSCSLRRLGDHHKLTRIGAAGDSDCKRCEIFLAEDST